MVILEHIDTKRREWKKAKQSCTLFISYTYLLRLGNLKLQPQSRQAWILSLIPGILIWERNCVIALGNRHRLLHLQPMSITCGAAGHERKPSSASTGSLGPATPRWGGERNLKQLQLLLLQVWGFSFPYDKRGCAQAPVIPCYDSSIPATSHPQNLVPAVASKKLSRCKSCRWHWFSS